MKKCSRAGRWRQAVGQARSACKPSQVQPGERKSYSKAAASAAFDITCLPGGNRPEKFEFEKLEARLRDKLPALMAQ